MHCVGNILLRLVLYTKLIHLIYSDNIADNSRFSVNDKIFAKERKITTVFHPGIIVKILENRWIKIRWDLRSFCHGSTSRVHESWIRDSNESRLRTDTDYCYDDNSRMDCFSFGRDGLFVRIAYNDNPKP